MGEVFKRVFVAMAVVMVMIAVMVVLALIGEGISRLF